MVDIRFPEELQIIKTDPQTYSEASTGPGYECRRFVVELDTTSILYSLDSVVTSENYDWIRHRGTVAAIPMFAYEVKADLPLAMFYLLYVFFTRRNQNHYENAQQYLIYYGLEPTEDERTRLWLGITYRTSNPTPNTSISAKPF